MATRLSTITSVLACALFTAGAAHAQDALLDSARALMAQRDAAGAYELLVPQETQRAGDTRFDYLLGISALDAGHVTRAIFALERVLAERPDDNLARAELGRAYLAAGEPHAARREFALARQGAMPPEAAATIDRVLGALQEEPATGKGGPVRGYLEVTAGADSNVNSASTAGQFALPAFGGIIFTLAPESRQRGDLFTGTAAGIGLQLELSPGWSFNGAANVRGTANERWHDMNTRQIDGSAGVTYATGPDAYSVALQGNGYYLDHDRYRNATGGSAQWQHTLDAESQLSAFAQYSRLTYAADSTRDADRAVLGLGYARAMDDGAKVVYGSVFVADEAERASSEYANYGHRGAGLRVGGEYAPKAGGTWFSAMQIEARNYNGPEPFFDATRRDRQLDLSLGVHFEVAPLWRLTPQITHTRSSSNVVLYDYRRTVMQLTLRREFK